MKKVIAILALSLLAGCAAKHDKAVDKEVDGQLGKPALSADTTSQWVPKVGREIADHIYDIEQYSGKACSVRLSIAPSGMVMAANTEGGDPAFCQSVLSAIKASTFPPLPKELQKQKSILFNFKP